MVHRLPAPALQIIAAVACQSTARVGQYRMCLRIIPTMPRSTNCLMMTLDRCLPLAIPLRFAEEMPHGQDGRVSFD
jgi:hypothetical protein